jgi:hypothetical protein
MSRSDLKLRLFMPLVSLLLGAGCSGAEEEAPEGPPPTPNVSFEIKPLTDEELLGVPREQVLLTLPWSQNVVSRDPAPNAARATLRSVEVAGGPTFDRTTFEFGTDTDFPGYHIVWDDSASARCAEERRADLGGRRTLLIRLQPAWTQDSEGKGTITQTSRRPALPSVATARQLCDEGDRIVWALGAADSTVFRVVELHTPPRLVVDVAHVGAAIPPTRVDSAAATPR